MLKTFRLLVPVVIATFVLTGCSQSGAFNNVNVDKPVSWDISFSEELGKQGWDVIVSPNEEQKKQVKDAPISFRASHADSKCLITYSSEPFTPKNFKSGDKFNTESFLIDKLSLVSLAMSRQVEFQTMQANVKDSVQKIDMLYTEYIEPYYGNSSINTSNQSSNIQSSANPKTGNNKPQGEIYSFIAARDFSSSPIDNPFYEVGKQYDANASKETTSVVYIQYQCLNKELDKNTVERIKKESVIVF